MTVDGALTFGLWYDLRQETPFVEKSEDFSAECPCIEERKRLDFTGVWLSRLLGASREQALANMRLFASEVAQRVRRVLGA